MYEGYNYTSMFMWLPSHCASRIFVTALDRELVAPCNRSTLSFIACSVITLVFVPAIASDWSAGGRTEILFVCGDIAHSAIVRKLVIICRLIVGYCFLKIKLFFVFYFIKSERIFVDCFFNFFRRFGSEFLDFFENKTYKTWFVHLSSDWLWREKWSVSLD